MKKFFKESLIRIKSETGAYWKKVQFIAASFSAIGASFQAVPDLAKIGTYIIEAGVIIAAVAQLTKKDPEPEQEKNK